MVYRALREAEYQAGLYTSPHLVTIRERMVVDDRPIGEAAFAGWTSQLRSAIEEVGASFFEATTAIAFADFAARQVDVAVVEVGLGGRLDSSNVLAPAVSAVTNVSVEHTEYLGNTLAEIAAEKAGIAKPNTPFVLGEPNPEVAKVLRDRATETGAIVVPVPPEASYPGPLRMVGSHQRRNAAVARVILHQLPSGLAVGEEAISAGFARAWLPGRLDQRGRWLFDVAHNPASMTALAEAVASLALPGPVHAVLGVLRDKEARFMVGTLGRVADKIWMTSPPSAPPDRQLDIAALESLVPAGGGVEADFERCLDVAGRGAQTVIVTGSFYTVGDAMARLPEFPPFG